MMSFLWTTNKKSHTGFRLVPNFVTLNDLERHNSLYFVFSRRMRSLRRPIMSQWLKSPILPLYSQNQRTLQRGLSAIAELLVLLSRGISTKLGTHIHHASGNYLKAFKVRGQSSRSELGERRGRKIAINQLTAVHPLPSNRQHLSYDVCLEVRGEIIRTVLCCIVY